LAAAEGIPSTRLQPELLGRRYVLIGTSYERFFFIGFRPVGTSWDMALLALGAGLLLVPILVERVGFPPERRAAGVGGAEPAANRRARAVAWQLAAKGSVTAMRRFARPRSGNYCPCPAGV
jgi:hypothetical protein